MDWAIADRYPRKHLPASTTLFQEGDFGQTMYLVTKGSLQISKRVIEGAEKVLAMLDAGQYVGEMSLLTGAPRSATAKAIVDAEVIEIDQQAFMRLLRDHSEVGLDLMRQMAHRLQEANEQLILIALEVALTQRNPMALQRAGRRMRFVATGSFAGDKTAEVLRIAAEQTQLSKHQTLVTSLFRAGRAHDALVYVIETEDLRDIMALVWPFAGLVQWDISPAIDVAEALDAGESSPADRFPSSLPL